MAKRYTRILHHLEDPLALAATEKVTKNISIDTKFDTKSKKQKKNMNKKKEIKKAAALTNNDEMGSHSDKITGAGKRT